MKMILKNKKALIFMLIAFLLFGVAVCVEIKVNGSSSENLTYISGVSPTTNEEGGAQHTYETKLAEPDMSDEAADTDTDGLTKPERPYKIDEQLWEIMEKAEDGELIPVSMWILNIDFEEIEKKLEEKHYDMSDFDGVEAYITEQRRIAREMFIESNGKFVEDHLSGAEDVYAYEYFPIIECSITKEKILCLASVDSVESVYSNAGKDVVYPDWMIVDC